MIGILYICTGKYRIFWKDFYKSCEKHFLPGYTKKYFVFTDAQNFAPSPNVITYFQERLEWPFTTLLRFNCFLKAEKDFADCEHLFFFNANIKFLADITDDILPTDAEDGLLAVLHPGFYEKTNKEFTYDRTPSSTAYIEQGAGIHYFMGGFNGGTTTNYLALIKTLSSNIQTDLENNIIALWHDESHLNRYLLDKSPKILTPEYGYPEGLGLPFKPKVLIRNKNKYGGNDYLRNLTNVKISNPNSMVRFLQKVLKKIANKRNANG